MLVRVQRSLIIYKYLKFVSNKIYYKCNKKLTTYEPKRIFEMNDENTKSYQPKHQDLFTLLLLQSHRIKIDRSADHVNVSCLADFFRGWAASLQQGTTKTFNILVRLRFG